MARGTAPAGDACCKATRTFEYASVVGRTILAVFGTVAAGLRVEVEDDGFNGSDGLLDRRDLVDGLF